MDRIALYLDEDVDPHLAQDLRQWGYDALAVNEAHHLDPLTPSPGPTPPWMSA